MPAVEYEKAKSEVKRLRGAAWRRNASNAIVIWRCLEDAAKKLEAQMKNSEIRSPMDGLLTGREAIDGELVADGTSSSRSPRARITSAAK